MDQMRCVWVSSIWAISINVSKCPGVPIFTVIDQGMVFDLLIGTVDPALLYPKPVEK